MAGVHFLLVVLPIAVMTAGIVLYLLLEAHRTYRSETHDAG